MSRPLEDVSFFSILPWRRACRGVQGGLPFLNRQCRPSVGGECVRSTAHPDPWMFSGLTPGSLFPTLRQTDRSTALSGRPYCTRVGCFALPPPSILPSKYRSPAKRSS